MPRNPRIVIPGVPHHVTQRGNRKQDVFFVDAERRYYLRHLKNYAVQFGVEILTHCLMTNHVHLVAVPRRADSFEHAFRGLHTRYAQLINARYDLTGRLWQGRFFANPLDEEYMWAAIRYVERNPVVPGLVPYA